MNHLSLDTDLGTLRDALQGELVLPGDAGWDDARQAWNLAVDQRPVAVALPRTAADVVAVVRFAAANGLRVAPQGTGHNASPLAARLDRTILLKTAAMRGVEIDVPGRRFRAEAGALWLDVIAPASEHGLVPLAGSSPDVGVVGYSLGGGIGWLSRRHGLAANSILSIEVVTADGRLRRVDADHDPELFFALRGGGGSYAIVTAIEMELFAVADGELHAGALLWPWERSSEVLHAWRTWLAGAPEAVTTSARILQVPPFPDIPEPVRGRQFVVIDGAVLGDAATAAEILAPLRALEPEIDLFAPQPPVGLVHVHMDPEHPVPGLGDHAILRELPAEAIDALVAAAGPDSRSPLLAVELRQLGGALSRAPEGAGALGRIDGEVALFTVGIPADPEAAAAIEHHLGVLRTAVAPYATGGVYLNFAERPADLRDAFPADVHARLAAVKAQYDPAGVIVANQPAPRA